MQFHKDVVIDLVCYRLHGHNEADEPACTQPLMYQIIRAKKTPRAIYAEKLLQEKLLAEKEVDVLQDEYRTLLDAGQSSVEVLKHSLSEEYTAKWTPFLNQTWTAKADTSNHAR
jgi:2-oxoglutarate dehydrogenase complex, dehydrogenase (E1) component, and related enzymes